MRKTGRVINCKICGKEKYKAAWELKSGGVYCSKECNMLALKGNTRWDHPHVKKTQFRKGHALTPKKGKMINCIVCNKEFYVQEFDFENRKYCSRECYWKNKHDEPWNKGKFLLNKRGENAPNWSGKFPSEATVHKWIFYNYGKASKCENPFCKYPRMSTQGRLMIAPKMFHWSNISYQYRRDREDWEQLCASCAAKKDAIYRKIYNIRTTRHVFNEKGERIKS